MRARIGVALALALALVGCSLKTTPVATRAAKADNAPAGSAQKPATPKPRASSQPLVQPDAPFSPLTPTATPAPAPAGSSKPGTPRATPAPLLALTGHVLLPATIISNNGGSIISNNGAGVVSNNGGGIITDNGGGLLTEGGSGFHLLALDARPAKGVTVQLVDAAGRRIAGADGKAIQAVTNDQGAFSITGALPAANVLAVVDYGQGRTASAAVVQGRTGELTIDFASSMATAYIIEKYVRSQPDQDPLKVFDRLTPDAELAARQATADALNTGTVKIETLALGRLVDDCDKLIQAAPTLGARMDDVKKLLVVGGLVDLGNGHTATHVSLNYVSAMAVAPDGTLYMDAEYDGRVWRLNAQGLLEAVYGVEGDDDGLQAMAVDAKNRLLVVKRDQVLRVENGVSTTLGKVASELGSFVMAGDGDTAYVANCRIWDTSAPFYTFAPGQAATSVKLTFGSGSYMQGGGRSADGKLRAVVVHDDDGGSKKKGKAGLTDGVYLIDPVSGSLTLERAGEALIDSAGHVFDTSSQPLVEWVNGQAKVVGTLPGDETQELAALAADGHGGAYASYYNRVYHVTAGGTTLMAGPPLTGPLDIPASDFGYQELSGLAIAPDGTMYIADHGQQRILKIGADQRVHNIEPTTDFLPHVLRLGPQGELYAGLDDEAAIQAVVSLVTPQGYQTVFEGEHQGESLLDFAIGPRGEVYTSVEWRANAEDNYQVACTYQGKTTIITTGVQDTEEDGGYILAVQPDGQLVIAGDGKLQRWSEAAGLSLLASNAALKVEEGNNGEFPGMVIDARNRVFIAQAGQVRRYDPVANTFTLLAGSETTPASDDDDTPPAPLKPGDIEEAIAPAFAPDGSLRFLDTGRRLIRQLPASAL